MMKTMNRLGFLMIMSVLMTISSLAVNAQMPDEQAPTGDPLTSETPNAQSTGNQTGKAQLSLDDMRTFTDVFNQIRLNYVEPVDDQTLLNSAINGMLGDLDPHSAYMQADQYRRLDNDSKGRYSGIGVEVSSKDSKINIVLTMPGGAAEKAGIVAGDIITSIDRRVVTPADLKKSINSLRGEVGTKVQVTVEHVNGEVSDLTLERDYIQVESVFSRPVDEDYGYFQITHFTQKTAEELQEQVEYMLANHNGPLKGVVLDLRNNGGGVLQPAVTIADGFLDDGLIVYTEGRSPGQLRFSATKGQWLQDVPVVILVNDSTASASEVLAGALQDHGRALIVGERTFGKGSVQSVLNLRNGSGMRLTTSRYYTPSGRSIQATGIQPDILIPDVQINSEKSPATREADLDHHLDEEGDNSANSFRSEVSAKDDYAMYQALIILKSANMLAAPQQLN
jgi:carboxyl-terminal processing protease